MISEPGSNTKIVLSVGRSIWKSGSNPVHFEQADANVARQKQVYPSSELHRRGIRSTGCAPSGWKDAVVAVHFAEKTLHKNVGWMLSPLVPAPVVDHFCVTRSGRDGKLAQVDARLYMAGSSLCETNGETKPVVEAQRNIATHSLKPETVAAFLNNSSVLGRISNGKVS